MRKFLSVQLILTSFLIAALPEGFVYVYNIDPTIQENIRYTTEENFVGQPIHGYKEARAILTREAAEALKQVQAELRELGYSLVIYDAYRPQKAVDHFVEWGKDTANQTMKSRYYPYVSKADVFKLSYVVEHSSHSRGSTVDVTIIPLGKSPTPIKVEHRTAGARPFLFLDDGTVDMGSSFDLFDLLSHHDCQLISKEHLERRNFLRSIMKKHGFKEYKEEWWHYTLKNEPYPNTYFDFDVK